MATFEQYEIVDFDSEQVTICFVTEAAAQTVESELVQPVTEQPAGSSRRADGGPFPCTVCGKTFARQSYIQIHMRTHTGEKPYSCEKCGAKFSGLTAKQRHMIRHTGVRAFKCDYCEKSYLLKHELTEHVRVRHSGNFEKPCKCDECGNAYRYPFQLKLHKRVHSGEKPLKCELCAATFRTNQCLAIHRQTHTLNPKERPLECPICKKLFKSKDSRDGHLKIHNPIKPHKCDLCGKGFHRRNKMHLHRKTHSGKDPADIKQHKEPEGPGKMFQCGSCNRKFALEFSLNLHIKRRHPELVASEEGEATEEVQDSETVTEPHVKENGTNVVEEELDYEGAE